MTHNEIIPSVYQHQPASAIFTNYRSIDLDLLDIYRYGKKPETDERMAVHP